VKLNPLGRKALVVFVQIVGYIVILYILVMLVGALGMIVMQLSSNQSGSFELATDFGRKYYEKGSEGEPLLIQSILAFVFSICCGLMFFAGFRMAGSLSKNGLAEFSSLLAILIAEVSQALVQGILGHGLFVSLIALGTAIAVYFLVRFNLYSLLRGILLDENQSETA
jgi:hypothetical protein